MPSQKSLRYLVFTRNRKACIAYVQSEYDKLLAVCESGGLTRFEAARMRRFRDHLEHAGDRSYNFFEKLQAEGEL